MCIHLLVVKTQENQGIYLEAAILTSSLQTFRIQFSLLLYHAWQNQQILK
jgi:hypothetical protein